MARTEVFFALMVSTLYIASTGQNAFLHFEYGTTGNLPCLACPVHAENTFAVQWYKSNDSDVFIKAGKSLAWWSRDITGSSQGFGLDGDFSMVITHVNLSSQGLYRCIVTPSEPDIPESTYDVKLDVYAKPSHPPLMSYIRQATGFKVTCSVSHIFPKTFPNLTSHEGNETSETNEDGTYNTAVSHLFPLTENTTSECLYSNFNFESMSTILIVEYHPGDEVQVPANRSNSDSNLSSEGNISGLWMLWLSLIMLIMSFSLVIILFVIHVKKSVGTTRTIDVHGRKEMEVINKQGKGQPVNQSENENVRTIVNSEIFIFGGKMYLAIHVTIMLMIQLTVIFLLIAYLTTAREMK